MNKEKIYGSWRITDELVGYPLMLYAWLRGKKIDELLEEKILKVKSFASKADLDILKLDEYKIEYDEIDNFFAYYFKKICPSKYKSFEEKIGYCLSQFKKEGKTLFSSSKLMILQSNFLNGAEKTLRLYFILKRYEVEIKREKEKTKEENKGQFKNLFVRLSDGEKFMKLKEEGKLEIDKTILAGFLNHLKNRKIIKNVSDKELREHLERIGVDIPKSTYSTGKNKELDTKYTDWLDKKFPKLKDA